MDEKVVTALLNSCESATYELEQSTDYKRYLQGEKYLETSTDILDALCKSFTCLLSYKVSKETTQRYTARLQVINILREWCRTNYVLQNIQTFRDERQISMLLDRLLEKYLTDDILDNSDSVDHLLSLSHAIMCLTLTNCKYKPFLEQVLLKLVEFSSNSNIEYLLCSAVKKNADLKLDTSTIEKIYESQSGHLIEQPLLDDFTTFSLNFDTHKEVNDLEIFKEANGLLTFASSSSYVFLLICAFLKELLIQLNYAPVLIAFIQLMLKRIKTLCENKNKDILDLYPRNLHSIVILLQIEPSYHTLDSEGATLKSLEDIYTRDKDTVIALLSQYPNWLKLFAKFVNSDANLDKNEQHADIL